MPQPLSGLTSSETSAFSEPTDEVTAQPSDAFAVSKRGLAAGLHVVATPIGNAADITRRALDVLQQVDLIACEDTRVSAKLLAPYGITTERMAYHDHNGDRIRPILIAQLQAGRRIALISDAGTPLVSDPGYKLVRAVIDAGLPIHVVPGASAPLAALILSGLPTDRFLFAGFLPSRRQARQRDLTELKPIRTSLIFFESGPRLVESLADMVQVLGDRPAAVAREITKLYEETRRGTLGSLARHYAEQGPPKGEIVIVIGPPLDEAPSADELDARLTEALGRSSLRDASAEIAEMLGLPKRQVYARALELGAGLGQSANPRQDPDAPD